jgi:hypothetical protein
LDGAEKIILASKIVEQFEGTSTKILLSSMKGAKDLAESLVNTFISRGQKTLNNIQNTFDYRNEQKLIESKEISNDKDRSTLEPYYGFNPKNVEKHLNILTFVCNRSYLKALLIRQKNYLRNI